MYIYYRDEINLSNYYNFILVDHHVSKLNQKTCMVIDHRPFDESSSKLPENCIKIIDEVGSCASLILNYINQEKPAISVYAELLNLLYGNYFKNHQNNFKFYLIKIFYRSYNT